MLTDQSCWFDSSSPTRTGPVQTLWYLVPPPKTRNWSWETCLAFITTVTHTSGMSWLNINLPIRKLDFLPQRRWQKAHSSWVGFPGNLGPSTETELNQNRLCRSRGSAGHIHHLYSSHRQRTHISDWTRSGSFSSDSVSFYFIVRTLWKTCFTHFCQTAKLCFSFWINCEKEVNIL